MYFCCLFWYFVKMIFVYRLLKASRLFFLQLYSYLYRKLGWSADLKEYVQYWTVVTGCTDGIGKAYTQELAERGIRKFILISRNKKKLEGFSRFLTAKYKAETKIFAFNFDTDAFTQLKEFLARFEDIGILINNVGMAPNDIVPYFEQEKGIAKKIFRTNAFSVIQMCEFVLPQMVKRDRGLVVNVASIQGWKPSPLMSTYSSSKAVVSFLSRSLSDEVRGTGVQVQCLTPIMVATKMTKYAQGDGWRVEDVHNYARQAVDMIGTQTVALGCHLHVIQGFFLELIPFYMSRFLVAPIYKMEQKRRQAKNL